MIPIVVVTKPNHDCVTIAHIRRNIMSPHCPWKWIIFSVKIFLPPASEGWGKVIFSLCVSVHTSTGGGTPHPLTGVPPSGPDWGVPPFFPTGVTPILSDGVPLIQVPDQGGGTLTWEGGTPSRPGKGVPPWSRPGEGIPPPPPPIQTWEGVPPVQVRSQDGGGGSTPNWNSIACTCYAAGGMPLAFTQEDFLLRLV